MTHRRVKLKFDRNETLQRAIEDRTTNQNKNNNEQPYEESSLFTKLRNIDGVSAANSRREEQATIAKRSNHNIQLVGNNPRGKQGPLAAAAQTGAVK